MGDGCFFCFCFSVAWISAEAFEFLCGQNQETWADRKLKQVLTLSFTQFHRSLPPQTQTPTATFHQTFLLLLFHFFSPSLSSFHKNTVVWQEHFPVNFSRLCVCPCVGPPGPVLKRKRWFGSHLLLTLYQSPVLLSPGVSPELDASELTFTFL